MKLETRASFGWPATSAGPAPTKNGLVVHYDGNKQGLAGKDHSECRAYWRWCRRYHMTDPAHRWRDIGYSYACCPHGIILEGRGFGREQAAQPGGNTTWVSCTFMSGDGEAPTKAQVEAFKELRSWLRGKGMAAAIRPHSAFVSTSCCGDLLRKMVADGDLAGSPAAKPTPAPRLLELKSPWMSGEDVRAVQRVLNANGAAPKLLVDGRYGSATVAAVKVFQKAHHLKVDGKVGPKTRTAMGL